MRIRPFFQFDADPDPNFHSDVDPDPATHQCDANLQLLVYNLFTAPFETSVFHFECPRSFMSPLNFDFDADSDAAIHSDTDSDPNPDPALQTREDPDPRPCI
jgi:hypothetical protein